MTEGLPGPYAGSLRATCIALAGFVALAALPALADDITIGVSMKTAH